MAKDIKISVRITSEINDKIEKDAKAQDRSAGYIIRAILDAHYKTTKANKK